MDIFIASNIKTLRIAREMTQDQFSKKLGIKRSALGSYEEDRATPPIKILIQISDFFEITLDEICRNVFVLDARFEAHNVSKKVREL